MRRDQRRRPEDTTPNAVSGAFYTRANVAFANLFGLNVLVDDNGLQANFVLGCEWDITGKNVDSIVFGNNMIGVFPVEPQPPRSAIVAALNAGNRQAFRIQRPVQVGQYRLPGRGDADERGLCELPTDQFHGLRWNRDRPHRRYRGTRLAQRG